MKKLIVLINCMFIVNILYSQDIAPSDQAQGYLEARNVMVDYATGIFHYKVPLYTFRSGKFELPVQLNYASKVMKDGTNPGIIDPNWTLNTGGVVTRTIRGGIADEDSTGQLFRPFGLLPSLGEVDAVNGRKRDGEADIFTVVFKGKTVHFVIRLVDNRIVAMPLEQTNVRIVCAQANSGISSSLDMINGWVVTDEDGNSYTYRQKELSSSIVREGAVSTNGIRGKSYISSWYLTRIDPRNSEPIIYNYTGKVNVQPFRDKYAATYHYGKPMMTHPFDYYKYEEWFRSSIESAMSYLNNVVIWKGVDPSIAKFIEAGSGIAQPTYKRALMDYSTYCRIMSQLVSFNMMTGPSVGVINYLDDLIRYYRPLIGNVPGVLDGVESLEEAKRALSECLREVTSVTKQQSSNINCYDISSPALTSIECGDKVMKFNYAEYSTTAFGDVLRLTNINVCNVLNKPVVGIELARGSGGGVARISFWGKDGTKFDNLRFDGDYSLIKSIIRNGKEIMKMEYERCNYVSEGHTWVGPVSTDDALRLKSITFKDPETGYNDMINYHYPYPGSLVYNERTDNDIINYAGFSDTVTYSIFMNKGHAFLKSGNAGIYYNYVEEEFVGKGRNTYLFYTPGRCPFRSALDDIHNTYAFWLNAVPLGTAVYDNAGNLRELTKNSYYTDLTVKEIDNPQYGLSPLQGKVLYPEKWFTQNGREYAYKDSLPQIRAYEYYLNGEMIRNNMLQQEILLDKAGMKQYFNLDRICYTNFESRTTVQLPKEQRWYLRFGGRTVLKEQKIYRFEGTEFQGPDILHFVGVDACQPYQRVEYQYDNKMASGHPTRISRTDSNGDCLTTITKRVTEIADVASPVIAGMKKDNIVAPVIKQQELIRKSGSGQDILLEESVFVYDTARINGKRYTDIRKQFVYRPSDLSVVPVFSAVDRGLFNYPEADYSLEQSRSYGHQNNSYFPVEMITKQDKLGVCYDMYSNNIIMKSTNTQSSSIGAFDLRSACNRKDIQLYSEDYNVFYNHIKDLYIAISAVNCTNGFDGTDYMEFEYGEQYKLLEMLLARVLDHGVSADKNSDRYDIRALTRKIQAGGISLREYLTVVAGDYTQATTALDDFINGSDSYQTTCLASIPYIRKENILSRKEFQMVRLDTLQIKVHNPPRWLKLFVVSRNTDSRIPITISLRGGGASIGLFIASQEIPDYSLSGWNLKSIDIDTDNKSDMISLSVKPPTNAAYVALVPADAVFEATSYNPDGTVFCRFDQNGIMERYEYDEAARLVRAYDQNGHLIRSFEYNDAL